MYGWPENLLQERGLAGPLLRWKVFTGNLHFCCHAKNSLAGPLKILNQASGTAGLKSLLSRLILFIVCFWKTRMQVNHAFELYPVIMRDRNGLLRHRQAPICLHKPQTETVSETWGICRQTEASSSIKKAWFGHCVNPSIAANHRRYSQVLLLQTSSGQQAADLGSLPLFQVGVQEAGRGTELC